jgi:DNA-binding NarL/FixJ family response regulator
MSAAEKIVVTVQAEDPLARAGIVRYLRDSPQLDLRDQPGTADCPAAGSVTVVLADQVDGSAIDRLRGLEGGGCRRLVLITSSLPEAQLSTVLESGVHAVVWRHEATADQLTKAILSASRGENELPRDLLRSLLKQLDRMRRGDTRDSTRPTGLTPREANLLQLVAEGLDTKEVAAKLACSERTVKGILHGLMGRMRLRNRAHAVAFAIRQGYI